MKCAICGKDGIPAGEPGEDLAWAKMTELSTNTTLTRYEHHSCAEKEYGTLDRDGLSRRAMLDLRALLNGGEPK